MREADQQLRPLLEGDEVKRSGLASFMVHTRIRAVFGVANRDNVVVMQRRTVVVVATALFVVAAVFAGNAILRPGCSLLPVALPSEPYRSSRGTPKQACAVLGRPMPEVRTLPAAVTRGEIGIDGPGPSDCCRGVAVGYVVAERGVAVLDIRRGDGIPDANKGEINATVRGAPAIVKQSQISASNNPAMSYVWSQDGLFLVLHIQLGEGISRDAADRMAESVR